MKTPLLTALTALALCTTAYAKPAPTTPITLNFGAVAKTADGTLASINCQDSFVFGTQNTPATLADLRFYVSNIKVLTKNGKQLPVSLTPSDFAQSDVGLIDLENGTDSCETRGSKDTNTTLIGTINGKYKPSDLVGVAFDVGVPNAKNHSLYSSADAPLNLQAMSWAWLAGRKFMKVELAVKDKVHNLSDDTYAPIYNVHFGRTGCTGEPATGDITCTQDNRIGVTLNDKGWQQKRIVLNLDTLFHSTDISQNQTGAVGCMSADADKDCAGVFAHTGLRDGTQRIFSLEK